MIAQLSFSQYYFYIYSLFGQYFSHRFVGYLAESAVESYGEVLQQIDEGKIKNVPAVSTLDIAQFSEMLVSLKSQKLIGIFLKIQRLEM